MRALVSSEDTPVNMLALYKINDDTTLQYQELRGHSNPISALCIAGDGRSALTGDEGSFAHFWDTENCEPRFKKSDFFSAHERQGKIS